MEVAPRWLVAELEYLGLPMEFEEDDLTEDQVHMLEILSEIYGLWKDGRVEVHWPGRGEIEVRAIPEAGREAET